MTQREMADILGVSPQFVSKWLNGKSGLSVSTAMRWAAILNVDFRALVTAKKDKEFRLKLLGLERGKRELTH